MRVTERNDSEKVADEKDLTFSEPCRLHTRWRRLPRMHAKLQSRSCAAEPMPHSRNSSKVFSNGQGEATNSKCYRCGKSTHMAT